MSSEDSRSSDDSPTSESEGCVGTEGLSDGKRRWDDSPAPLGECPKIGCRGVKTMISMLFESVSEYRVFGGSGGLRNIRITQRRRNGLSWFGPIRSLRPAADDPYTQEHPKSGGLHQSVKEERFGRGLAGYVLILKLPRRWWSLPLIDEEGDGEMRWRRGSW